MSRAPLGLVFLWFAALFAAAADVDSPAHAAARLGAALESGREADLANALPADGRLELSWRSLGEMDGDYGAGQVRVALAQFLAEGRVSGFHVVSDRRSDAAAWLTARCVVHEPGGLVRTRALDLRYRRERGEWVLRAIRERDP